MIRQKLFILFLLPASAFAQSTFFSVGANVAIPAENLAVYSGTGLGLAFRVERPLNSKMAFMGTLEYNAFTNRSRRTSSSLPTRLSTNSSMLIVQGGVIFFPIHITGLFFTGELGFNFSTLRTNVNGTSIRQSSQDFTYAPGVGFRNGKLEVSYRFQFTYSDGEALNYSGIRIAYIGPFSKSRK